MLISGDDVIRNIPEQVAKNTEDIAELNHRMPVPEYFYTKEETDDLLAEKADSSSVYTKAESDALLAQKADSNAVYTKAETNAEIDKRYKTVLDVTFTDSTSIEIVFIGYKSSSDLSLESGGDIFDVCDFLEKYAIDRLEFNGACFVCYERGASYVKFFVISSDVLSLAYNIDDTKVIDTVSITTTLL